MRESRISAQFRNPTAETAIGRVDKALRLQQRGSGRITHSDMLSPRRLIDSSESATNARAERLKTLEERIAETKARLSAKAGKNRNKTLRLLIREHRALSAEQHRCRPDCNQHSCPGKVVAFRDPIRP